MLHLWSPIKGATIQSQAGLRTELSMSTQIQLGILQFIFLFCSRTRGKALYVQIYDYILTLTSLDCVVLHFFPDPFFSIPLSFMYGLLLSSHSWEPPNRCYRC